MSRGFRSALLLLGISLLAYVGSPRESYAQGGGSPLSSLLSAMNSFDSFRANIVVNGTTSGTVSYKRPGNIHIKFSDGRVISANGRTLWFYSPDRGVTGKQDLRGSTSGISGLLSGYNDMSAGRTVRLKSNSKRYSEIIVSLDGRNLPRSIKMKRQGSDSTTEISFSGIATNLGLSASLFNYQPPSSSIIIENPLNQKE